MLFVYYIDDIALNSITAPQLFEILPIYNNVPVNITSTDVIGQRLNMLRVYKHNVLTNYNDHLNSAIVHFQSICPEMLYIKPYEYWINLAKSTYLNSSADLIEIKVKNITGIGHGTNHIVNRGLFFYLENIINNNVALHSEFVNNRGNIHCATHVVTNDPNYYVSNNYLLEKIRYYRMNRPYVIIPEDYMSQANWMFREPD